MSAIIRLATRLAVVEALLADPVIAEATQGRVFDSEIGAIDPEQVLPVIIVHTETERGEALSVNNGGPPFDMDLDLVFEIAHVARGEQDGEAAIFRPETSRELEASLDLLESRIAETLAFSEEKMASALRRFCLKRIVSVQSERFASDDIGVRIASRFMTLTVKIFDPEDEIFHPLDPLPVGEFSRLPEPLRSLAPLFPAGSSARETLRLVNNALPPPSPSAAFNPKDRGQFVDDVYPAGSRPQND